MEKITEIDIANQKDVVVKGNQKRQKRVTETGKIILYFIILFVYLLF